MGFAVAAALVGTLVQQKQYQAVALIQLLPRAGQEVNVDAVVKLDGGGYLEGRDRARTQLQIIQSRKVRAGAIDRYLALGHTDLGDDSVAATEALGERLTAGPREDTQLVEVRVMHPDPVQAAQLANLVAQVYWEGNLEQRRDAARDAGAWLASQEDSTAARLKQASDAVLDFKGEHDLVDIDERVTETTARLSSLQRASGEATTQRVLLESQLTEHEQLLAQGRSDVLGGMLNDPSLTALARERAAIQTEAADVLARYGERHPEHQRVKQHIERVDALILAEVRRIVRGERALVQTLHQQEARLEGEADGVKSALLGKQRLMEEYAQLKQTEDQARRLHKTLSERGAEVELQAATGLSDVRLVDPAVPPTRPSKPRLIVNLAAALGLGLFGGVGLALFRSRSDDTVRTPRALRDRAQAPVLGLIPTLPDGLDQSGRDTYVWDHPRSPHAESVSALRAVLQHQALTRRGLSLLVTSSVSGEGKSTLAAALARSFAGVGARTVLIDGELRRPRQHEIFGVERVGGLGESLEGQADPLKLTRPTDVPRLDLLTAGCELERPGELVASPIFAEVLALLATTYHVVIVDSPPVGVLADALMMGRGADGVLMVARVGLAPGALVEEAAMRLRQSGAELVGTVLNGVALSEDTLRLGARYFEPVHSDTPEQDQAASR